MKERCNQDGHYAVLWLAIAVALLIFLPKVAYALCVDDDGDGYGAFADAECTYTKTDCVDTDPDIYPGAQEKCDLLDNDCDGEVDEGCSCVDKDRDGYGDQTAHNCGQNTSVDCDDTNKSINPSAEEICDGIDNNCDGNTDEGCSSQEQQGGSQTSESQEESEGGGEQQNQEDKCLVLKLDNGDDAVLWQPYYQDSEGNLLLLGKDIKEVGKGIELYFAALFGSLHGACDENNVTFTLYIANGTKMFSTNGTLQYDDSIPGFFSVIKWDSDLMHLTNKTTYYFTAEVNGSSGRSYNLTINPSCTELCGESAQETEQSPEIQTGCRITSFWWLDENGEEIPKLTDNFGFALAGSKLNFVVAGQNCDGLNANLSVVEADEQSVEVVDEYKNVSFENGYLQVQWIAKRVDDEEDNLWGVPTTLPEYSVQLDMKGFDEPVYAQTAEGDPLMLVVMTMDEYNYYQESALGSAQGADGEGAAESQQGGYDGGTPEQYAAGYEEESSYSQQQYGSEEGSGGVSVADKASKGITYFIIIFAIILVLVSGATAVVIWRRRKKIQSSEQRQVQEQFKRPEQFKIDNAGAEKKGLTRTEKEAGGVNKPLPATQEGIATPQEISRKVQNVAAGAVNEQPVPSPFSTPEQEKSVLDYIHAARIRGVDDDTIRRILINGGWKGEQVDYALRKA